jgi:predicted DCC family thiol-disulfide oxidoreductase YuxK
MRPAVLIYDGECPVCVNAVEWIRGRARPGAFEFLSCHSEELAKSYPSIERTACLQAMHLVLPDGTVRIGGRAVPEILRRLRGCRWAAALFRLPGAGMFSRAFYRWFAKRRHRAAGFFFPTGKGRDRKMH